MGRGGVLLRANGGRGCTTQGELKWDGPGNVLSSESESRWGRGMYYQMRAKVGQGLKITVLIKAVIKSIYNKLIN